MRNPVTSRDILLFFPPLFALPIAGTLMGAFGVIELSTWGRSIGLTLLAVSFGLAVALLQNQWSSSP